MTGLHMLSHCGDRDVTGTCSGCATGAGWNLELF
jgi:hypothetical protein